MSVFDRIQQSVEQTSSPFSLPLPSSLKEIQNLNPAKVLDSVGQNLPNPLSQLGFPNPSIITESAKMLANPQSVLGEVANSVNRLPSPAALLAGPVDLRIRPNSETGSRDSLRGEIVRFNERRDRGNQVIEVKPGDTLWGIARGAIAKPGQQPSTSEIQNMIDEICRKNGITNPNKINPGDKITIPGKREDGSRESQPPGVGSRRGVREDGDSQDPRTRTYKRLEEIKPRQLSDQEKEADAMARHYARIDRDKNDRVTKEELEDYTESLRVQLQSERDPAKARQLKDDIMSLDRACKNFDSIKNKSNDDWGFEQGISRRDVAKHSEDPVQQAKEERDVMRRHFDNIDKDTNDRISKEELQDYLRKLNLQKQTERDPVKRQQLAKDMEVLGRIVETKFDTIENASHDDWFWENGISRRDLNNHVWNSEFPEFSLEKGSHFGRIMEKGGQKESETKEHSRKREANLDQFNQLL